jgi:hypothetical protein
MYRDILLPVHLTLTPWSSRTCSLPRPLATTQTHSRPLKGISHLRFRPTPPSPSPSTYVAGSALVHHTCRSARSCISSWPEQMSPQTPFVGAGRCRRAHVAETNTIIAACVMFIAILIAWNLPILRDIIAALKVSEARGSQLTDSCLSLGFTKCATSLWV